MKKQFRSNIIVLLLKGVIIVGPFMIFGWLAIQYFSIMGDLKIEYNFKGESPFISEWRPSGRAFDRAENLRTGESYQEIVGEPAYIDVEVPRSFDSVDLTMDYSNEDNQIFEVGIVTNTEPWSVRLQSFDNYIIDQALEAGWVTTENDNGVMMLQKEQLYGSLADLESSYPKNTGIGTYGYDLTVFYQDDQYEAQPGELVIDNYLRGSHTFLTYIKNEDLDVEFTFADINSEFNQDPVTIQVSYLGGLYYQDEIADDGIDTAVTRVTDARTASIILPNLLEGLYQISFKTTDDIIIQKIRTKQNHFVVKDHIFLVGSNEYSNFFPQIDTSSTELFMDGKGLMAKTDHEAGIQDIVIDNAVLGIDKVHQPFYWSASTQSCIAGDQSTGREVVVPKNDAYLATEGFFSFTADSFFDLNHNIEEITELTEFDDLEVIVYQNYQAPAVERRFDQNITTFNLDGVAGDRKSLIFTISAPGIDRSNKSLLIHRVGFEFHRQPLWQRILQRLR